jgi:hypothetical protein
MSPMTDQRLERRVARSIRMGISFTETSFGNCIRWDRAAAGSSIINFIRLPSRCCITYAPPPLLSVLMDLIINLISP